MSAEIISFPLKPARVEQQRWIPAPRPRHRAPARSLAGWLRLAGVLMCIVASWFVVLGTAHLIAIVL
jgi:hypothetical protein